MSTIKRSKTDAFSVKESVNIVKLAEAAFEQISLDQLTDVVVETPTDGDILVYSSDLLAWENVPQAGLNYDLEDLDNITITSVSDGQVLTWDSGTSKWVNETPTTGATTLDGLTDVTITTPSNGQVLKYNGSAWVNGADSGATPGGSDTYVQYNDGGALGGESTFTYNKTNNELTVSKLKTNNISGIVATDQMTIVTGESSTIAGIGLSPSAAAPTFVTEMSAYDIYHAGNTKTVAGQAINGSGDVVLSDADVPATVVTDATSARTIVAGDTGKYIRFTATGAKTCTFDNTLTAGEYHIRNAAASGDVTLTASSTTLNAPAGGTLVLEPGMTCTVKFVGTAEFDVIGQTVAA